MVVVFCVAEVFLWFCRCCKVYRDDDYERIAECLQTPSSEALALALCDPMRRRSSYEVDSLDESFVDSGLSTLRSNNGYDSEQESMGRSDAHIAAFSCSGDTSDTEVRENTQMWTWLHDKGLLTLKQKLVFLILYDAQVWRQIWVSNLTKKTKQYQSRWR